MKRVLERSGGRLAWAGSVDQQLIGTGSEGFGGGKFKVNFHHVISFVGTHNFRTYGEEKWRQLEELDLA